VLFFYFYLHTRLEGVLSDNDVSKCITTVPKYLMLFQKGVEYKCLLFLIVIMIIMWIIMFDNDLFFWQMFDNDVNWYNSYKQKQLMLIGGTRDCVWCTVF
jgi:hypothetical protein